MTRTTALFIAVFVVAGATEVSAEEDWDAGFDDATASAPEVPKWVPEITGSVLVDSFHYVRETKPSVPFFARHSVDGRLRAKVENTRVTAVLELLLRHDHANPRRNREGMEQAYVDVGDGTTRLRVGRSLLRWGTTNLHRPADVLDIRDYTDFIEGEKRASYVVWGRRKLGPVFLDGYVLPVPMAHVVPVAALGSSSGSRVPSSHDVQLAGRVSGSLWAYEWELGYAFMFDRIPLPLPTGAHFRRQHIATFGVARAFGKTRVAAETAVTIPRNKAADDAGVVTDDGYVSSVVSVDHTTAEFADAHTIQVAVDLSVTQPLSGTLPRDQLSRLRYPFPLAVLSRITYHATDWHLHLNLVQGLEGFGFAELPALGGKHDLLVQPELEVTVANYVQLKVGAALMSGASGQLVGRYRSNSRIYWSAQTKF